MLCGEGILAAEQVAGRAGKEDFAPAVSAFGAHVDNPVGLGDEFQTVLDDDAGAALVAKAPEQGEELAHAVGVELLAGLVEDEDGLLSFGEAMKLRRI